MRTIFLTICVMTIAVVSQAQIRVDAGFAYGTDVNNLGIGFGSEIFVKENIAVSPGVIIYFEDADIFDNRSWWEINANGHYYFANEENIEFFGLAGLNIATRSIELGEARDSDTEVGLNLGIGANYKWTEQLLPYVAFKYIAGTQDQAVFTFGMRFLVKP